MPTYSRQKALGQNFLISEAVIRSIVDATLQQVEQTQCEKLLEIGPGKGAITDPLLNSLSKSNSLTLIEKDDSFAQSWKVRGHMEPNLRVIHSDFLDLRASDWLEHAQGVVSNLPYSAGTAILTRLSEHPTRLKFMILMFQLEVAQRILATPGEDRDVGSLSLWIQNFWHVKLLCKVPRGAFLPPPKVESAIVVLTPRSSPKLAGTLQPQGLEVWQNLIKEAFKHRRKMLRAGLSGQPKILQALRKSGIDPTLRAEQLTWEQWETLYSSLLN